MPKFLMVINLMKRFLYLLSILTSLINAVVVFAQDHQHWNYKEGKTIFEAQCASCHSVHKQLVGPPLADIQTRRDTAWLYAWIKNSQAVIKSGDKYGGELFNEYNKSVMPAFNLSNAEIERLLFYIDVATKYPFGFREFEPRLPPPPPPPKQINLTPLIYILSFSLFKVLFSLSRATNKLNRLSKEQRNHCFPNQV